MAWTESAVDDSNKTASTNIRKIHSCKSNNKWRKLGSPVPNRRLGISLSHYIRLNQQRKRLQRPQHAGFSCNAQSSQVHYIVSDMNPGIEYTIRISNQIFQY